MWGVIKSVLAAFFGVQKEQQRLQDFTEGKATAFIVVGILLAFVLVIGVIFIASMASR